MASLRLLDLQVERFDIPLDLFDPLDDLFFEYFLAMSDIICVLVLIASCVPTLGQSCFQIVHLSFILSVSERTEHLGASTRAIRRPQVVHFE